MSKHVSFYNACELSTYEVFIIMLTDSWPARQLVYNTASQQPQLKHTIVCAGCMLIAGEGVDISMGPCSHLWFIIIITHSVIPSGEKSQSLKEQLKREKRN